MKILVTVKALTDPDAKIKVKEDGSGVKLDGIELKPNPFDEIAVEEALRLVESGGGGEVVVVSLGDPVPSREIRRVLAMEADRAIAVKVADDDLDALLVAKVLAKVHAREKPDLWILGKQAVDGDSNQVGQMLAGLLDLPQATFASKEEDLESEAEKAKRPGVKVEGGRVTVVREVDGGLETLSMPLPAVITADLRLNLPRYAKLKGIMAAKKKDIEELTLADLGLSGERPRLRVVKYEAPPARTAGVKVANVDELLHKLRNEAKVL